MTELILIRTRRSHDRSIISGITFKWIVLVRLLTWLSIPSAQCQSTCGNLQGVRPPGEYGDTDVEFLARVNQKPGTGGGVKMCQIKDSFTCLALTGDPKTVKSEAYAMNQIIYDLLRAVGAAQSTGAHTTPGPTVACNPDVEAQALLVFSHWFCHSGKCDFDNTTRIGKCASGTPNDNKFPWYALMQESREICPIEGFHELSKYMQDDSKPPIVKKNMTSNSVRLTDQFSHQHSVLTLLGFSVVFLNSN